MVYVMTISKRDATPRVRAFIILFFEQPFDICGCMTTTSTSLASATVTPDGSNYLWIPIGISPIDLLIMKRIGGIPFSFLRSLSLSICGIIIASALINPLFICSEVILRRLSRSLRILCSPPSGLLANFFSMIRPVF